LKADVDIFSSIKRLVTQERKTFHFSAEKFPKGQSCCFEAIPFEKTNLACSFIGNEVINHFSDPEETAAG